MDKNIPTPDQAPEIIATTNEVKSSSIKKWGGGYLSIKSDTWKSCYTDGYIGEMLRDDLVQAAMIDELDYFNQHRGRPKTADCGGRSPELRSDRGSTDPSKQIK